MSAQCKSESISLLNLKPKFVEFTATRGILRCLRPKEDLSRARGLIFICPKCRAYKQTQHYNIFLFPDAPSGARPGGRFIPLRDFKGNLAPMQHQTLLKKKGDFYLSQLTPGDVPCGWTGFLTDGVVSWRSGGLN